MTLKVEVGTGQAYRQPKLPSTRRLFDEKTMTLLGVLCQSAVSGNHLHKGQQTVHLRQDMRQSLHPCGGLRAIANLALDTSPQV